MATQVRMPEVLAGATKATISSWLVSVDQEISVGTPLAEIETDKAVVEYASEVEGTLLSLLAEEGAAVAVGAPILLIGMPGDTSGHGQEPDPGDERVPVALPGGTSPVTGAHPDTGSTPGAPGAVLRRFISPLVRRLAAQHGLDLSGIRGSGPNGRIVRRDVDSLIAADAQRQARPAPQHDPATSPAAPTRPVRVASPAPIPDEASVTEVPITPMRRAIASRLSESKATVPHFYLSAEVRVGRLLQIRAEANASSNARVSINDFVVKAVAGALREVPEANCTWGETVIRRHDEVDIAMAVALDDGLVTPVLRGVDRMSLSGVAGSARDFAARARTGGLRQHELEGGTFTVSNLGMYGTREFSAIINPPHAGILAVGAVRKAAVVADDTIKIENVMTVTLSADHRVLDGVIAARWLAAFTQRVENPLLCLV